MNVIELPLSTTSISDVGLDEIEYEATRSLSISIASAPEPGEPGLTKSMSAKVNSASTSIGVFVPASKKSILSVADSPSNPDTLELPSRANKMVTTSLPILWPSSTGMLVSDKASIVTTASNEVALPLMVATLRNRLLFPTSPGPEPAVSVPGVLKLKPLSARTSV